LSRLGRVTSLTLEDAEAQQTTIEPAAGAGAAGAVSPARGH
jgi:hypothetical protein